MGRIFTQGMEVKNQDRETLEAVLVHATEAETRDLSRYLQALATIGNITPLLGLLGTVLGMIKAFMVIQEMGARSMPPYWPVVSGKPCSPRHWDWPWPCPPW
jgi:biopolymer transport protein ExbB